MIVDNKWQQSHRPCSTRIFREIAFVKNTKILIWCLVWESLWILSLEYRTIWLTSSPQKLHYFQDRTECWQGLEWNEASQILVPMISKVKEFVFVIVSASLSSEPHFWKLLCQVEQFLFKFYIFTFFYFTTASDHTLETAG